MPHGRRDVAYHTARLAERLADELRTVDLVERLRTHAFSIIRSDGAATRAIIVRTTPSGAAG
jgi:hypothetical protein